MRIARESWVLAAICAADLITTLWFVGQHGAAEANPMMRFFLAQGVFAFILAKAALCVGPLAVLEWARRQKPHFVRAMLRLGIVGYLGSYGIVVWRINAAAAEGTMSEQEMARIEREAAVPVAKSEIAKYSPRLRSMRVTDAR